MHDVRRWGVQRAVNSLGRGRCVLRLGHRPRSRRQHSAARVVPLDRLVYVALCGLSRIPHRPRGRAASTPDVRWRRLSNPEVRVVLAVPFSGRPLLHLQCCSSTVRQAVRQLFVPRNRNRVRKHISVSNFRTRTSQSHGSDSHCHCHCREVGVGISLGSPAIRVRTCSTGGVALSI
eukprot:COSAG01_NODE_565_length_15436_cov_64.116581_6_plen_176_part_00